MTHDLMPVVLGTHVIQPLVAEIVLSFALGPPFPETGQHSLGMWRVVVLDGRPVQQNQADMSDGEYDESESKHARDDEADNLLLVFPRLLFIKHNRTISTRTFEMFMDPSSKGYKKK